MEQPKQQEDGNHAAAMEIQEGDWKFLPTDLALDILSRLPFFKDRFSFKYVCKAWREISTNNSVSSSTSLSSVLMESRESPNPSLWLMYGTQYSTTFKFYNPMYKGVCEFDFPELSGAILRYSKDGWLLMSRGEFSVFFFNPFTKEMITLPDLPPLGYGFVGICFTTSPTTPECMVFGTFRAQFGGQETPSIYVYNIFVGEHQWYHTWFEQDAADDFEPSYCNPVFHNGLFYVLGRGGELGVSDPKAEEISWELKQLKPLYEPGVVQECYLMECDGQLLSLFLKKITREVFLYSLDETEMIWKRIRDLGDNMMFVSHCSSFAVEKEINGTENKVYFPQFRRKIKKNNKVAAAVAGDDEEGPDGVFYSLETNKFHTFFTNFSSKSMLFTSARLHSCWIQVNTQ